MPSKRVPKTSRISGNNKQMPKWAVEFAKKFGISHPASLSELTDAMLTRFESRADPLRPEEARVLSRSISACAHSLNDPDLAIEFLNARRVLDQAAWLANPQYEPTAFTALPNMDDLYHSPDPSQSRLSDLIVHIREVRRLYAKPAVERRGKRSRRSWL
jgi:hypothetical protein